MTEMRDVETHGRKQSRIRTLLHERMLLAFVVLFFCLLIASIFWGERLPVGNGLGWDGKTYAHMAERSDFFIHPHMLSTYYLQRVLPSFIINLTSLAFHFQLTAKNIILAFSTYNTILIVIAVFVWNLIAQHFKWSAQAKLISFVGLFLNFAILKQNTYYPVLTDTSAFVIGLIMCYFFLTNKSYCVLLTGIMGAFVFPTFLYAGVILFLFQLQQGHEELSKFSNNLAVKALFSAIGAIFLFTLCLITYHHYPKHSSGGIYNVPLLFTLSKCVMFVWIALGLYPFSGYCISVFLKCKTAIQKSFHFLIAGDMLSLFRNEILHRFFFVLVTMSCFKFYVNYMSNGSAGPLTMGAFGGAVVGGGLAYPFVPIVSHVIYFGPLFCLLIFFWKETVEYVLERGIGLTMVFFSFIVLFLDPESRQIINFFPFVAIILTEILNRKNLSWGFVYVFIFLSIAFSKVWLPLNHGSFHDLLQFPAQWYFMSLGPWMSRTMYAVNASVVAIAFVVMFFMTKHFRTSFSKKNFMLKKSDVPFI
jgi:hypothetical protein